MAGPQKLHFFYLVFYEKGGLEWMLISPIFSSFVSYNANHTRETVMSTQFPFFFFKQRISSDYYYYDERNLIIYNKLYWQNNFLCLIGIIGKKRKENWENERLSRPTFLICLKWAIIRKKPCKTSATFGGPNMENI